MEDDATHNGEDAHAGDGGIDLTKTLYGVLHRLAVSRMSREQYPQTLQATALVHEAWLRMGADKQPHWHNRAEFISAVAKTMRRILIDRARRRQAIRHGGEDYRIEMDSWDWERLQPEKSAQNDKVLIDIDDALEKLASIDPESAKVVELRYFAGAKVDEIAEVMEFSVSTAERRLSFSRAWLEDYLEAEFAE